MPQEGGSTVHQSLATIFSHSLRSGMVPQILTYAHISPNWKGGLRELPSNYRPISLTSHIGKVLERLIRRNLVAFLESRGLLDPRQHGSRASRSTLSQLLVHQDQILHMLEEGFNIDAVYLDFS